MLLVLLDLPELLERLTAAGVKLAARGGNIIASPKAAVTPEIVDLIRAHKSELLQTMATDAEVDARRTQLLAMLATRPETRYALLTDAQNDPESVLLALAIRGIGMCEMEIPRIRFDGIELLELVERHSATVN